MPGDGYPYQFCAGAGCKQQHRNPVIGLRSYGEDPQAVAERECLCRWN